MPSSDDESVDEDLVETQDLQSSSSAVGDVMVDLFGEQSGDNLTEGPSDDEATQWQGSQPTGERDPSGHAQPGEWPCH